MSQSAQLSALFPSLVSDLRRSDLEAFAVMLDREILEPGRIVVKEGEVSSGLILVEQGVLLVQLGTGAMVGSVGPGAIIGDISLLDGGPVSATVTTKTAAVVRVLPLSRFHALRKEHPAIAMALARGLCRSMGERIRTASNTLERITTGTEVPQRQGLLDALLSLFRVGEQA